MATKTQTVGEFLFDYLHAQGVRHAFGIPGDFALPTFRWLEASKLTLYTLTHEPSVGFAADGYARVNGLGVACVTYGVGGLNMLNSVACAYAEKSPLLVISGGPSPNDRRADGLIHHKVRSFDSQRKIFEEVTCANTVLLDPETAANEIIRVVSEVQKHSRPGYIEVPFDVVDLPIKPPVIRNEPPVESDREILEAAIAEAAEMIAHARQPVMIADIELHRHKLTDLAVEIAAKFNIPIASTLLSKSLISETNPLYMGVYSGGLSEPECQKYVESSDCIILLGAFLSDIFLGLGSAHLPRKKSILATTEKIRIGLQSFDQVLLRDFLEGVRDANIAKKPAPTIESRMQEAKPLAASELNDPMDSEAFFRILALHMPEGSTVVADTGDALLGAIGLRTSKTNNFLSDAYYLSMGFAMPAAIGAMAAAPDSRAYVIIGDGAFQMTGMELSTAAKYGMNPIVFVLNNDGYGTQRHIIDGPFNNIQMWNYTKITEVLRAGQSARVATKGELDAALKAAQSRKELTLIEVIIPRDDCSPSLRRLGEGLGELRDPSKKAKKA